jgi:hypothetical protein
VLALQAQSPEFEPVKTKKKKSGVNSLLFSTHQNSYLKQNYLGKMAEVVSSYLK